MPFQRHYVSGFFAQRDHAQHTYDELVALGIAPVRVVMYHSDTPASDPAPVADSNAVLEHVVVDAGIGTVAGTVLGGLAEIALVAANVSLFIASPLIAPLVMLGWGASLGGLIGAAKAVMDKPKSQPPGRFNDLVRDAISAGQVVLVVQTDTDDETALARKTMQAAVGDFSDTAAAAL
jgi:hypothetical protein